MADDHDQSQNSPTLDALDELRRNSWEATLTFPASEIGRRDQIVSRVDQMAWEFGAVQADWPLVPDQDSPTFSFSLYFAQGEAMDSFKETSREEFGNLGMSMETRQPPWFQKQNLDGTYPDQIERIVGDREQEGIAAWEETHTAEAIEPVETINRRSSMMLKDDGTIDEFWDRTHARMLELYGTGKYDPQSNDPDPWDVARVEVLHTLQETLNDPRVIQAVRDGDKQKLATMAEDGEITPELARRGAEFVVFEDVAGDRSRSTWRADRAVFAATSEERMNEVFREVGPTWELPANPEGSQLIASAVTDKIFEAAFDLASWDFPPEGQKKVTAEQRAATKWTDVMTAEQRTRAEERERLRPVERLSRTLKL